MARDLSTCIEIEAPPERVWAVLVDLPSYAQWNPFIVAADGVAEEGQRLTLRMAVGGRTHTVRPTVTAREDGRLLRWRGRLAVRGVFDGDHRHELEATRRGTRYVHRERLTGLLVPFVGTLLADTQAAFEAMDRALKAHVERSVGLSVSAAR